MRLPDRGFLHDVRYAVRGLAHSPGFAATAIAVLAIGIGGVVAILSLVQALLLRPLPFAQPERLVMLWETNRERSRERNVVGPYNYARWRERNRSFEDIAGFAPWDVNVSGGGEPERVPVGAVTGNFFSVLGVRPLQGRGLIEADSATGAAPVVVLSEGYWKRRFAGDPAAIGRQLDLGGEPTTIVGVMPAALNLPARAALWVPLDTGARFRDSRGRWLVGLARLRPEVGLEQARDELQRMHATLAREFPDFNAGWSATAHPLHADLVRDVQPALLVLLVAVALVLLVACANVANLLLARSVTRQREIAIRCAIGASAGRVLRQLLTESLILALLGGAAGLALAHALLAGMLALLPAEVPLAVSIGIDAPAALATLVVCLGSAVLFGLAPALHLARPALQPGLKEGAAVRGGSHDRQRLGNALVVAEVALSVVLLAGTGVVLRSFWRLAHQDAGFDPRGVLALQVNLAGARYAEPGRAERFFSEAAERLGSLPGVESAGAISWMPYGVGSATSFELPDQPKPLAGQEPTGEVRFVTPRLFETLGIPLVEGRDFSAADTAGAPRVVIVNRALAQQFWRGQSALGRRLRMNWGEPLEAEIVGVVGDVRLVGLDTPARASLYWPQAQVRNGFATLMVRTALPVSVAAPAMRAVIAGLDPELPANALRPLTEVASASLAGRRFLLLLLGSLGAVALLLASIGLHGVLAVSVARRRPELAVRIALGARPADVVRLVVGQGLRVTLRGSLIGLSIALLATRALQSQLYMTDPWDPLVLAGTVTLLGLVALAAVSLPAQRAATTDPIVALRHD